MGWVDIYLDHSALCLCLLRLVGLWPNWQGNFAKWENFQCQVNQTHCQTASPTLYMSRKTGRYLILTLLCSFLEIFHSHSCLKSTSRTTFPVYPCPLAQWLQDTREESPDCTTEGPLMTTTGLCFHIPPIALQVRFRYQTAECSCCSKVARWQNLIPSFPWIAPGWRAWGRNPRKGSNFAA